MKIFLPIFLFSLAFAVNTTAQTASQHFNLENKLALEGYDPVSYFQSQKPTKGKASIQAKFDGAIYQFSSEKNKEVFLKNPQQYQPAYGGWCAYAMGATGEKVSVDPMTFKILNGKLYLFYNAFFNNTLTSWNKDEQNLKAKADKNWKQIVK